MKIRMFEAFAGYGSQLMAAKRLMGDFPGQVEFETVGVSEIEPNAIKAYTAVHGDCPNYGDICGIDWAEVPDFNLLTYSFPCQDISNAGLQKGFEEGSGSRSSLLWECRRAIEAKRPKWLLMENVKALVQRKFMPDLQRWIDWLSEQGYESAWQVVNAKDQGVAQNRERVFMVSMLRETAEERLAYNFPDKMPLTKCVEDYMEENVDESYFIDRKRITEKVLSDILEQPNVRAEMEQVYHDEWREKLGKADTD